MSASVFSTGHPIAVICQSEMTDLILVVVENLTKLLSSALRESWPPRIAIVTGSGQSVPELKAHQVDTLITGELRQQHFNIAQ